MHLSAAEIIFYTALAGSIFLALHVGIPQWLVLPPAIVVAIVGGLLVDRIAQRARSQGRGVTTQLIAPWRQCTAWIVPTLLVVLALALLWLDAPIGVVALICGIGAMVYLFDLVQQWERFRAQSGRSIRGPAIDDWAVLAIGILFCAGALLIWYNDWRDGLVTFVISGGCTAVAVAIIARKLRERSFRATKVSIAGGVHIPVARGRIYAATAGMALVGSVLWLIATDFPVPFRAIAALIVAVGIAGAIAALAGWIGRQSIRFDQEGILFRQPATNSGFHGMRSTRSCRSSTPAIRSWGCD